MEDTKVEVVVKRNGTTHDEIKWRDYEVIDASSRYANGEIYKIT